MFRRWSSLVRTVNKNYIHSSSALGINVKNVEEVKIPVPWGHIAGKWWGSRDIQPIVALHGWQDNAGTWLPLVALLPDKYAVLAIDFPGSGISSFIPPFYNYHFIDSVQIVRRVRLHFDFDLLTLLGHSGGSATSMLYSAVYPDDVLAYFGIDYLLYAYGQHKKRAQDLGKLIDKIIGLGLRDQSKNRTYSKEEAVKSWVTGTKGSVNKTSAEILLERGAEEVAPGEFMFRRDHRLKTSTVDLLSVPQVEKLVHNIACHVTLVKASLSPMFDSGIKYCPNIVDTVRERARSFEMATLHGGHHLHMDHPEQILPLFEKLLLRAGI